MKDRTKKRITDFHKLSKRECNIKTAYTGPFAMIQLDGQPLGNPLSVEDSKIVLQWLQSVVLSYNDQYDRIQE